MRLATYIYIVLFAFVASTGAADTKSPDATDTIRSGKSQTLTIIADISKFSRRQQNIAIAWSNIKFYLAVCGESNRCQLNEQEFSLLRKLHLNSSRLHAIHPVLKTSNEDPRLKRGSANSADSGDDYFYVTDSILGGNIVLNFDRLYLLQSDGRARSIDVAESAALLAGALTAKLGAGYDETMAIVAKLTHAYRAVTEMYPMASLYQDGSGLLALNNQRGHSLRLYGPAKHLDVSENLRSKLICKTPKQSEGTIFMVRNIHWESNVAKNSKGEWQVPLYGIVRYLCVDANGMRSVTHEAGFQMNVFFQTYQISRISYDKTHIDSVAEWSLPEISVEPVRVGKVTLTNAFVTD